MFNSTDFWPLVILHIYRTIPMLCIHHYAYNLRYLGYISILHRAHTVITILHMHSLTGCHNIKPFIISTVHLQLLYGIESSLSFLLSFLFLSHTQNLSSPPWLGQNDVLLWDDCSCLCVAMRRKLRVGSDEASLSELFFAPDRRWRASALIYKSHPVKSGMAG